MSNNIKKHNIMKRTKAQKKSALIALLRHVSDKLDNVCLEIGNADLFREIEQQTKSLDLAIDQICKL